MTELFVLRALAAGLGLAVVAAPLGCFVVWRRMAYFGETVSQGGLIGVALGLMLSLDTTVSVLAVAVAMALLLAVLARQQVLPLDSILGLLAHVALAAGVVGASLIKGPGIDLMSILFGEIFAVTVSDLAWIYGGGAAALAVLVWIWRPLLSISVHEDLAAAEGVPVERIRLIFVVVLAVVVAIALKVVGALLAIAFLIMPAAAARTFSETPEQMAFLAVIIAASSVALGLFVSVTIDVPAGPSIVLVMAALFAAAMLPLMAARQRG